MLFNLAMTVDTKVAVLYLWNVLFEHSFIGFMNIFFIHMKVNFHILLSGIQHQKCAVCWLQVKRMGHWWPENNPAVLEKLL